MNKQVTAVIEREGDGYISFCPEVDVASQGTTVQEASENLREAVELFFESASQDEISRRLHNEVYITRLEVLVGYVRCLFRERSLWNPCQTWIYAGSATWKPRCHATPTLRANDHRPSSLTPRNQNRNTPIDN